MRLRRKMAASMTLALGIVLAVAVAAQAIQQNSARTSGARAETGIHKIRHVIVIMQENGRSITTSGRSPALTAFRRASACPTRATPTAGRRSLTTMTATGTTRTARDPSRLTTTAGR